ncbi:MAG: M20 family metallopeptidase, partial [Dehalococcoidales bacterium]|nr:M20 family metallopeptidase [Dehalococcoidales bacterium]
MDIGKLKSLIAGEVDARYNELRAISRTLHDNPEIAFEETRSSARLVRFLESNGFTVETGICKLPTAFRAVYGAGQPQIAFLAEYDALPKVGHACGHNLIGTASAAAGVAARRAADELGGSIVVFGTPGEELYGGKAIMTERGAFTDVDFAMITHPGGGNNVVMNTLACETLEVEFFGKAAHAAGEPEKGINALEAMIQSFNGINSLRQHVPEKSRIHGVITDGGEAANIVPAHTAGMFIVRSENDDLLENLKKRVIACFTGAARATGARLKYNWGEHYAAMRSNLTMARLFKQNMEAVGHPIRLGDNTLQTFSTDVGNVSRLVPAIQPLVSIAPDDIQLHTPGFAKAAATEEALGCMLDAARAMAMTAVDILADPDTAVKVREEFRKSG